MSEEGGQDKIEREFRIHQLDQVPLSELKSLLKLAVSDLRDTKYEFDEYQGKQLPKALRQLPKMAACTDFKEVPSWSYFWTSLISRFKKQNVLLFVVTSKEYEQELESSNEANQKRADDLELECDKLKREYDKLHSKYYSEIKQHEKENSNLKKQLDESGGQSKLNHQKLVNLEIEYEDYERQIRISEQIISDLEQKLDTSLEEIALLQTELDELKEHSQEQIERLKQQLEETGTELQVKEKELKRIKFQALINEPSKNAQQNSSKGPHQGIKYSKTKLEKTRMSEGISINQLKKLNTQDGGQSRNNQDNSRGSQYRTSQTHGEEEEVFERSDLNSLRRPESARAHMPVRQSITSNMRTQEINQPTVQEEESNSETHTNQDDNMSHDEIESIHLEHVEELEESKTEFKDQEEIVADQAMPFEHSEDENMKAPSYQVQYPSRISRDKTYLDPSYGPGFQMNRHQDFDEQLLLQELDLDELIECEDIELNPFMSQNKHMLSILDNVLCSIDDRISQKRSGFYGGYGNSMGYGADEYGAGSFNTGFGGFKGQNNFKNSAHGTSAAEKFDSKQRNISLLY